MSKNKNIYGWWMPWHELVGIPLLIYFVGKRKIIKTLLSEKIAKAQINAEKIGELTIKEREKKLIEYERLDHFFSYHFKDMEKTQHHTFEDKIDYCLTQYKKESFRHLSASRAVILRENFLSGAEKTLILYFLLEKKTHRKLILKEILIGDNTEPKLKKFLIDHRYIDENYNLIVDNKSLFVRLHKLLKDEGYINPDYHANTITEIMNREYNSNFDNSIFSKAIITRLSDEEKDMQEKLIKTLKKE